MIAEGLLSPYVDGKRCRGERSDVEDGA